MLSLLQQSKPIQKKPNLGLQQFFQKKNKVIEPEPQKPLDERLPLKQEVQQVIEKKRKKRTQWNDQYQLIRVDPPQLVQNDKFKKRFQVKIQYKDSEGKKHTKCIKFGHKQKEEFVDSKNESTKQQICSRLTKVTDVFHPNHWRLHLLNNTIDIKQNYIDYINKFL